MNELENLPYMLPDVKVELKKAFPERDKQLAVLDSVIEKTDKIVKESGEREDLKFLKQRKKNLTYESFGLLFTGFFTAIAPSVVRINRNVRRRRELENELELKVEGERR